MELQLINFPSGIRMVFCQDTENYVVTDKETQTMRSEFIYLGKEDSIENYMGIDRNTPIPNEEEEE